MATRPTGKRSLSGGPTSPGVWKMEKSASSEVLGCRLNSFPASEENNNMGFTSKQMFHRGKYTDEIQRANLPFCFEGVGVQTINIVKDHVVVERYIGTAEDKGILREIMTGTHGAYRS